MSGSKVVRPDEAPMTWADKAVAWIYYGPSNYVRGQLSRDITLDRSIALSKEYSGAKLEPLVTHADYRALEDDHTELDTKYEKALSDLFLAREELASLRAQHEMVRQCCMDETVRATRLLGELQEIERNQSGLVVAFEELTVACEEEFGCDEIGYEGDYLFEDDDTVSDPDSSITFGMIRRARKAINSYNLSLAEVSGEQVA